MTPSSPVVFFGNEQLCTGLESEQTPIFDALLSAGYSIAAVVIRPDKPRGRSKTPVASLIKTKAIAHGIPVLQPTKLIDLLPELNSYSGSIGILASYGRLVPPAIIDWFEPRGIVNIHPSLLPRYRGSSPIESALLARDAETGVSLMRLSEGMDEGDLFAQTSIALPPDITKQAAYELLANAGANLLMTHLPGIIAGTTTAKPQSKSGVTYTTMLRKQDGILDLSTDTAAELEAKIRAYAGFPKSRLTINGIDVIITSASIVDHVTTASLVVSCRNNTYLQINELIAPSGKKMNAEAFIRGYQK